MLGINTPSEILIEIEDIEAEVENLQAELKDLKLQQSAETPDSISEGIYSVGTGKKGVGDHKEIRAGKSS